MKLIKPIYVSAFAALILSSCSPKLAPMVSTNATNIDKLPLKTSVVKEDDLKRWSHLDLAKDTIPGMSTDKAYSEFLKGKKGTKVVVGVIDSGIDIDHEDLKGKIWVNSKEIAGNNKDDDNNGYVDDINGWNFLGDSNDENLELTRIVKKGPSAPNYAEAKKALDKQYGEMMQYKPQMDMISKADKAIKTHLNKELYTVEDLKKISTTDSALNQNKMIMLSVASQVGPNFHSDLKEQMDQVYDMLNYNLNVKHDGRKAVGDNPDDINDKKYGNGNVKGPDVTDGLHGTHVAGIIAQIRGNGKGGDGVIADNVQIMALRAVPNGDEYDKDIALAIRYAADNGAKVINGSFGKDYSPNKEWVWEAIKYAASKDVLIIHAAGNDGKDLDLEPNFPNDEVNGKEISNNFMSIGALNKEYGANMVANFSNYATNNVDIYSPGNEIYATIPNNKYKYLQGTSMASPNVAGVAALVRSYYPNLTASQVKQIIMDSGTPITTEVVLGEKKEKRSFTNASKSGKIVNAYNALLMAEKMSKK
ncbi:S8 family peptidase [Flavobacterium aquatile]|uniref:Peptidase S8 n=1 Tax=Flavobacterium aquatile LMG 4008 = ATCC 11947 TaxID=1453498 RepID=A0A095U2B0_9FLAO|nr:S8 family peptidase [Flavobacterium aquatile]KGD68723.1 peptidase S8 [Flavobacterium aquatile LMG 4008 = ATCC 11947]OXA69141.1 peptidase S8 [Flavobacterium aquatile] [Flavobacterium aquatile LMG 4008 = ATCC 11947]